MSTGAASPMLIAGIPLLACVGSAVPTAWVRLLIALETNWPLMSSPAVAMRFFGAVSLVLGHSASCRKKTALSLADKCYLTGASLLCLFFGGSWLALSPPALIVSFAGLSMLGCFLILGRGALQDNVTTVTRLAVTAAVMGSSSLAVAGVVASVRPYAATFASFCFLFANSVLLFLLGRARTSTATSLAQALKVLGSFLLASANSMAIGWATQGSPACLSGVLPKPMIDALFSISPFSAFIFLAGFAISIYAAAFTL